MELLRAGELPVGRGSRERAGLPVLLLLLLLMEEEEGEEGILEGRGDARGLRGLLLLLLTLLLREPPALKFAIDCGWFQFGVLAINSIGWPVGGHIKPMQCQNWSKILFFSFVINSSSQS